MSDRESNIKKSVKKCLDIIIKDAELFNVNDDLKNQYCSDVVVNIIAYYTLITVDGNTNDKLTFIDDICSTVKLALKANEKTE